MTTTSIPLPLPLPVPVALNVSSTPSANPSASSSASGSAASGTVDPKLTAAAKQFEAIFVRQMLSAARKSSFGDTMTSSDGVNTFREMQDSQYADIAANKGAFGIAGMITKQLAARHVGSATAGSGAGSGSSSTTTGSGN